MLDFSREEEVAEAVSEAIAELDLPAEQVIPGLVLAITNLAESQLGSDRETAVELAAELLLSS